tara:strand:- start:960 stop:1706 length:747 start_codon:yes stop_codon:yes gene_type:complete
MYKILKRTKEVLILTGALAAMMFATSSVNAGEGYRGFSIGIIAGDATVDTHGKEHEKGTHEVGYPGGATDDMNTASVSKDVDIGSVFVEYSFGNILAMTVGAEYIPGTHSIGTESRTDTAVATAKGGAENDTGTRSAAADISNLVTLYFEPGIQFNDWIGVYAKAGAMGMQIDPITTLPTSSYDGKKVVGGVYGGGIKVNTPIGLFLKLETIKVEFPNIKLESRTGNKNIIEATPDMDSTRLAIGWNF